jgi:hypothetical protein
MMTADFTGPEDGPHNLLAGLRDAKLYYRAMGNAWPDQIKRRRFVFTNTSDTWFEPSFASVNRDDIPGTENH